MRETLLLTLFTMGGGGGGGGGAPPPPPFPTRFSSVTSANIGVSNKSVPSASPYLLSLNQDHPSKKAVFLVKSL